jgi:hypothetical protein
MGMAALKWQAWQVVHWLCVVSVSFEASAADISMWQGGLAVLWAIFSCSKVLVVLVMWA